MALIARSHTSRATSWPPQILVPARGGGASRGGIVPVTDDTSRSHSAVWGAIRLRADMVSTFKLGVYRTIDGMDVQVNTPPILSLPGGERCGINEWLWSSQADLDRVGNSIGIITAVDGYGKPARIELQSHRDCSVIVRDRQLVGYRIAGKVYPPEQIWHEKQYTESGMHVGLSPIAYAAMSVSSGLSAQQFALQWFGDGGVPMASFTNKSRTVNKTEAQLVKARFKQSVANRDLLVTGNDWEYKIIQAEAAVEQWIATQRVSDLQVCRFMGVPADLIDVEIETKGSIKYSNMTQRNLEFLILNLQPALVRRENAFTNGLLPAARKARFDSTELLRMDPAVQASMYLTMINARLIAPSEARAAGYNRPPYTQSQLDEFATLFPGGALAVPGTNALSGVEPPA